MNTLDVDYLKLAEDILSNGVDKNDRTGTGTISVFGRDIKFNFNNGFPILTTKKISFKNVATELIWFLKGRTDLKFLLDNNCHIWVGDAYKYYTTNFYTLAYDEQEKYGNISDKYFSSNAYPIYNPLNISEFVDRVKNDIDFSNKWGELGPIYGKMWRNWNGIDQIKILIDNLKYNPDSRRLLVMAWNVDELDNVILPPCHYGYQCYSNEMSNIERIKKFMVYVDTNKLDISSMSLDESMDYYNFPKRTLSLKFTMRSTDFALGLPYNITSYGLLLEILCNITNMIPSDLICSMGDAHIYKNHIDGILDQVTRTPKPLPKLMINRQLTNVDDINLNDFTLLDYNSDDAIKFTLSN